MTVRLAGTLLAETLNHMSKVSRPSIRTRRFFREHLGLRAGFFKIHVKLTKVSVVDGRLQPHP